MKAGRGNAGLWTRRKTKNRFPSAPTALGNRKRRDSHISTASMTVVPQTQKPKTKTEERRPGKLGNLIPLSRLILG